MRYRVEKIEEFNDSNIDQIVTLLNDAFSGEFHFTKEWFVWKHINSYFGQSLAWAVFCGKELVGIRLYSKWHSFGCDKQFVQAVDTATHPNHQRKGLFALLIKESLSFLNTNDIKIFNFPNCNSYPQYLKYGWKDSNKINWNVCLLPKLTFVNFFKKTIVKNESKEYSVDFDFINWRFVNNPCHTYKIFYGKKSVIVFKKVQKVIPYYQVVFSSYDSIDSSDLSCFLLKNGIFIARYINTDIKSKYFSRNCFSFVLNTKKGFNFVTRNLDHHLSNVSLSDTDFI